MRRKKKDSFMSFWRQIHRFNYKLQLIEQRHTHTLSGNASQFKFINFECISTYTNTFAPNHQLYDDYMLFARLRWYTHELVVLVLLHK